MKSITTTLLMLLFVNLFAQQANFIQQEKYLDNPKEYLSRLDTNYMRSKFLLDRTFYDSLLLSMNGYDKVTTIQYSDFYKVFKHLNESYQDSNYLGSFDSLLNFSELHYANGKLNLITALDFNVNRISRDALENGDLIEGNEFLQEQNSTVDNYLQERVVAMSILRHHFYGDDVQFILYEGMLMNNQDKLALKNVEMDFDSGRVFSKYL